MTGRVLNPPVPATSLSGMSDPIDSSDDLREQMEQFDRAELEADKADEAGFEAVIAQEAGSAAPRRSFPRWVIWMIAADVLIGIVVVAVIFAA